MTNIIRGLAIAAVLSVLPAGPAAASSTDALSFRLLGWYHGKEDISSDQIKCEIPNITDAIADSNYAIGLWNTYGSKTLFFPDINNPLGNPCGGWLQIANFLQFEGITVDRVVFKMSIPGSRRWSTVVPTSRAWPTACRAMRKAVQFVGNRIDPASATDAHSSSGAPNIVFIKMQPIVRTDVINCLRSLFSPLPTDTFSQIPVRIQAFAIGITDQGRSFKSNTINYTLNLRHTCGNGRVDDGEECDPVVSPICARHVCDLTTGRCTNDQTLLCATDDECSEVCTAQGDPSECLCLPAQR